jgi:uncharacterized membrane protein
LLLITIEARQSIYISLPPEKVFTYMSDLENLVDWSNAVISARNVSEGAVQVGTRVRSTIRFLGRWTEMTFMVIECKPSCDFTIKSISGVAPCLFYYRFEPIKDGGTVVSQEAMIQLTAGCLAHPEEVVRNAVHRQLEFDLRTLRDMLEASAATSRGAG